MKRGERAGRLGGGSELSAAYGANLIMPKLTFDDAIAEIAERDPRFHPDAYTLLRDALDFTMRGIMKEEAVERHVTGEELLDGFRRHALEEFGPMAYSVLDDWGVRESADVGAMVFNLIGAGVFGKSENDSPEDFAGVYDFEDAFLSPFRPRGGGDGREARGGREVEKRATATGQGGGENEPS